MFRKLTLLSLAAVAGLMVACGGRGTAAGGSTMALPPMDGGEIAVSAALPAHAIGEDLPTVLGTIKNPAWGDAIVGGFTQTSYSQTLAFPPGTKITIHNLSKTTAHTFNVVMMLKGHDADFPKNPSLSMSARGGHVLSAGYASGLIAPGKSVSVLLTKPGTYLVGCAIHYAFGMRDVLVVAEGAKPGPQATPPASSAPSPSPTSSGGGGGW